MNECRKDALFTDSGGFRDRGGAREINLNFFLGGGGSRPLPTYCPIARGGVAGGPAGARARSQRPSIFYRKAFPVRPYCSRPTAGTGLKRSTSYLGFVFMLDLNILKAYSIVEHMPLKSSHTSRVETRGIDLGHLHELCRHRLLCHFVSVKVATCVLAAPIIDHNFQVKEREKNRKERK